MGSCIALVVQILSLARWLTATDCIVAACAQDIDSPPGDRFVPPEPHLGTETGTAPR